MAAAMAGHWAERQAGRRSDMKREWAKAARHGWRQGKSA